MGGASLVRQERTPRGTSLSPEPPWLASGIVALSDAFGRLNS
jgi:hypothetical protein